MNSRSILGLAVVAGLTLVAGQPAPAAAAQAGHRNARYSFPSVGLVPGQTLRVTVANHRPPQNNPPEPDRVLIVLVDADGQVVADSGQRLLPAVQSQSFDVPREKIDRAGDAGTGRVQVRAVVVLSSTQALPVDPCRPGVEVFTTATGETSFAQSPPRPHGF